MRRAWKSLNATDARTKKSPRPSPGRNSCRQMRTFLRRCLKCLQVQRAEMQCCLPMLPHQGSDRFDVTNGHHACQWDCALTMSRRGTKRRTRVFFSCRACQKVYAIAVAVGKDRGHKEKGTQTCRSKDCKRKWTEPSSAGAKRQRYCPACRKRWPFHLGQSALTGTDKLAAVSGHRRLPGAAATRSLRCLCLLLPTGRKAKKIPFDLVAGHDRFRCVQHGNHPRGCPSRQRDPAFLQPIPCAPMCQQRCSNNTQSVVYVWSSGTTWTLCLLNGRMSAQRSNSRIVSAVNPGRTTALLQTPRAITRTIWTTNGVSS
jgi:hypothetical protein